MTFLREQLNWDRNTRLCLMDRHLGPTRCALSAALSGKHLCAGFCGGHKCHYCRPYCSLSLRNKMAIPGLFSTWITPNILATSRPSSNSIRKFDLVSHFRKNQIVALFNMQQPFEHGSCGDGVGPSGFSYDPYEFMNDNIYYYNFSWPDYGGGSMEAILDVVTVMQNMLLQGKVAVHCHAGLGRTGLLIACYLMFNNRLGYHEAIQYVRYKRPGSIQTDVQVQTARRFQHFLAPYFTIFDTSRLQPFTLSTCVQRQRMLLHGSEGRRLRNIPRILYVCYKRLVSLAIGGSHFDVRDDFQSTKGLSNSAELIEVQSFDQSSIETIELSTMPYVSRSFCTCPPSLSELKEAGFLDILDPNQINVVSALLTVQYSKVTLDEVDRWKNDLNTRPDGWVAFEQASPNAIVVSKLLLDWIYHLKCPVIRAQEICAIDTESEENVLELMEPLERVVICVLILTARLICSLGSLPDPVVDAVIKRFSYAFCQIDHNVFVSVNSEHQTALRRLPRLSPESKECLTKTITITQRLIRYVSERKSDCMKM